MKALERFKSILLIAGVGFFLISFVGMGLAPWTTLKNLRPPEGFSPYSDLEKEGRQIFINEGCWHCHTQFVRPVANEELRYGPVSDAAEHMYEIPQLFGTRRIGPDLAREAGKRTDDWHFAHFWNPRSTVPWSVMPPFPWLFEEKDGKLVPTRKARALVAYMQALGKNRLTLMESREESYRKAFVSRKAPESSPEVVNRGQRLFQRECIGCHGPAGDGYGLAKNFLLPPAQDLTSVHPTPEYVYKVLSLGVPGSAMPHFREYNDQDLWALSFYVGTLYKVPVKPSVPKTPELVARGQTLYNSVCFTCHGMQGHGDGPAGGALKPAPASFSDLRPSPVHIYTVLEEGIPGTAMTSFQHLPEEDKWGLVYYVSDLAGVSVPEAVATTAAPTPPQPAVETTPQSKTETGVSAPEPSAQLLIRGQEIYAKNCATCHGEKGDGTGPAGTVLQPPAANFTDQEWKYGSAPTDIYKVVHEGVAGTGMAPFNYLPQEDLWAVVYYVKSFSDENLRKLIK